MRPPPRAGEIRTLLPERVMRSVPGRLGDAGAVAEALVAAVAKVDPGRCTATIPWLMTPRARTYVLSKMWGLQTEPALRALRDAFPDLGVTFRRADTVEE